MRLDFFVPGIPRSRGSKRPFRNKYTNKIALVDSTSDAGKAWMATVRLAALEARVKADLPVIAEAVSVTTTFVLPRPKGHFGKRGLRPSAPPWPTGKPDHDKLGRGLFDSCSGVLWRDDSCVVHGDVWKVYGDVPGAHVRVETMGTRVPESR